MLIELEEWEKSVQVLDGLIEEDDEIVDTWYLLGTYFTLISRRFFNKSNIFLSIIFCLHEFFRLGKQIEVGT